eukprot:scaffold210582_cov16-Tisochrysis_lutea.AAC.1
MGDCHLTAIKRQATHACNPTHSCSHGLQILDFNYLPALLKWVDKESLPVWLGGSSHGTLLEDVGP